MSAARSWFIASVVGLGAALLVGSFLPDGWPGLAQAVTEAAVAFIAAAVVRVELERRYGGDRS